VKKIIIIIGAAVFGILSVLKIAGIILILSGVLKPRPPDFFVRQLLYIVGYAAIAILLWNKRSDAKPTLSSPPDRTI
jgi:hypothetical protein